MKVCFLGPFWSHDAKEFLDPADADRLEDLPGMGGFALTALVQHRLAKGQPTEVITLDPRATSTTEFHGRDLKYTVCPRRGRGLSRSLYSHEVRHLREVLRRSDADIIHANWAYEYGLAAAGERRPTLLTVHDHAGSILRLFGRAYWVNFLVSVYVIRRARHLAAVSPYNAEFVRRVARRPVAVIPNPAPPRCLELGDRLPGKPLFGNGAPVVFSAISSADFKNPRMALRAFEVLRRRYPGARYHLAGDGLHVQGKVAAWARDEGLAEGVDFKGPCSHDDVLQVMAGSDIVLHPSMEEACSCTIVEAMAMGRAIVAGRGIGGTPWVLDEGGAGVLVDVSDPQAMGSAMISLVEEPERTASLARRAFIRARGAFGPESVLDQYARLYESILAEHEG
jgi:L-malate glycosyltransferase